MRQSLEKIKEKIKRSTRKKEDIFKKYRLSSRNVYSEKVEFIEDSIEPTVKKRRSKNIDDEILLNENDEVVFINKIFFKKIKIEYIDKKALRYLGPIFISTAILGIILGIIFNF